MAKPWYEVPCGLQLMKELNQIAPMRDHSSDGTIGDAAHQAGKSDHNPDAEGAVRAVDLDNGPAVGINGITVSLEADEPGLTMETIVQFILGRCRAGLEKRITYIIYYKRIWAQDNGWRQETYNGSSLHEEHAHFSFSHSDVLANSIASYHLEDIPVALTNDDRNFISSFFDTTNLSDGGTDSKVGHPVWNQGIPDATVDGSPHDYAWKVLFNIATLLESVKASLVAIENTLDQTGK